MIRDLVAQVDGINFDVEVREGRDSCALVSVCFGGHELTDLFQRSPGLVAALEADAFEQLLKERDRQAMDWYDEEARNESR